MKESRRPSGTTSLGLGIISLVAALVVALLPFFVHSSEGVDEATLSPGIAAADVALVLLWVWSLVGAVLGLFFGLRGLRQGVEQRQFSIIGIALSALVLAYFLIDRALRLFL